MSFIFEKLWSNLEFSFGNLLSKSIDVEKLKKTDESSKTNEKLIIMNTINKHLRLFPIIKADENSEQDSNPWQNMIIKGPSTYSKMRKAFDDVLITCQKDSQKFTKTFNDDDWALQFEGVKLNEPNNLKINVNGKMHTPGIFSPFFQIGDDNNIGVNIKAHESISINAGISKRLSVYKDVLWSSVAFQKPAAVLDTKVEVIDHPLSKLVNMEASGMFGHNFGKFGVLAGFNLALDNSHLNWEEICQAVSLGIVTPTMAAVLTIQPNDDLYTIEGFLKYDSFQLATRSKRNYKTGSWNVHAQEVGLKYKHSENIAYGIKLNLAGNITAGTWLNTSFGTLALLTKLNDIGSIENIGISIDF